MLFRTLLKTGIVDELLDQRVFQRLCDLHCLGHVADTRVADGDFPPPLGLGVALEEEVLDVRRHRLGVLGVALEGREELLKVVPLELGGEEVDLVEEQHHRLAPERGRVHRLVKDLDRLEQRVVVLVLREGVGEVVERGDKENGRRLVKVGQPLLALAALATAVNDVETGLFRRELVRRHAERRRGAVDDVLVGGEKVRVHDALDGFWGVDGVEGGDDEVAGFGGGEGDLGGFAVAEFADDDDVGVLAHALTESFGEGFGVAANFTLFDEGGVVLEGEFDGVFQGDDSARAEF